MIKALVIILAVTSIVCGFCFGISYERTHAKPVEAPISATNAIHTLEWCKLRHQEMVDNPELLERLQNAGFSGSLQDHEEWVMIYGNIIDLIKASEGKRHD